MNLIFWFCLFTLIYIYLLYPILLILRAVLFKRPINRGGDQSPSVSIVIAAYNEEQVIKDKIENMLSLDYPKDKMEIIIASDGSSDKTNEIVSAFHQKEVHLLALPRQGKAKSLDAAVEASHGEILVFSDANSMFRTDAIKVLTSYFNDLQIGGVAGNQVYLKDSAISASGQGEQSYWSFDSYLKEIQTKAGNTISATGAIYAIRRNLFQGVPEGVTDDFVTSARVILQGYRLVFAPESIAYEPVAATSSVEFGRKVRIITRGLSGVIKVRKLLNPFQYGFYSVQLFSHKVLRRLAVVPILLLFVANLFLWQAHWFYLLTLLGQIVLYLLALTGWIMEVNNWGKFKVFSLPYYFCAVYLAALFAIINILRGQQITRWTPQRIEE